MYSSSTHNWSSNVLYLQQWKNNVLFLEPYDTHLVPENRDVQIKSSL